MGLECDPMLRDAKPTMLVERAGALLKPLAPGLVPAGLAAALVGLWLASYWITVAGLATAIFALVGATSPDQARRRTTPRGR
jgi:hypothetical protein